ncbi:unnamed protein product [Urochloa humidicola]
MGFKIKHLAACLCFLFLFLFTAILLYILPKLGGPGFYSKVLQKYAKTQPHVHIKGINDSFTLPLDTLEAYDMATESSGFSKKFTRPELANMPPNALGLLYIPRKVYLNGIYPTSFTTIFAGESSFVVSFTMSLYEPSWNETMKQNMRGGDGLAFLVLPASTAVEEAAAGGSANNNSMTEQLAALAAVAGSSVTLSDNRMWTAPVSGGGGNISVEIGGLPTNGSIVPLDDPNNGRPLVVHLTAIEPALAAANYTVWIEYIHLQQCLSVYVASGEVKDRPDNAVAVKRNVTYSDERYWEARFGLFSTVGQLTRVHTWNTVVEGAPYLMKYSIDTRNYKLGAVFVSLFLSLAATIVAAAAIPCVAWYFMSKQRRWKKEMDKLTKTMQSLPGVPTQVDFADIRKATDNFHETMKLGRGGFSSVYRCRLPEAASGRTSLMEVAVKKFTREIEEQRYVNFLAEVSIINRLRHKNVVPLIGWSYNKGEPLLIYEYMTNGSLDQHLFRRNGHGEHRQQMEHASIRQWHTRYSVARDIATGLHYVHHEHEPMVLHRDIKASNIMLDSNFQARLGDFGIACTVAADKSYATGTACGTLGYIAPEFAMSHRATRQTDIYAFGVLILEVVTGKRNRDVPEDDGHVSDWVWRLHGEGKLLEAVDDHQLAIVVDEARRLLLLGLACTSPNPADRPSMAHAVQVITKLAPPPDVPPEKPAFVWPPKEWRSLYSDYSTAGSTTATASTVELVQIVIHDQPSPETHSSTTFFSV